MAQNILEQSKAGSKDKKDKKKDKKGKKKKSKKVSSSSSSSSSSSESLDWEGECAKLALQFGLKPKHLKLKQMVRMDDLCSDTRLKTVINSVSCI